LTGPSGRTGRGRWLAITNAAPGQYTLQYGDVPYYATPASQTDTLVAGGTITFIGNYTFADANTNGMSDAWEASQFGEVSLGRTQTTDTDGDGATDYAEFVGGTDPGNAIDYLRLNAPLFEPGGNLRFTWTSSRGRSYRLLWSPDLQTWTPFSDWVRATSTAASLTVQPPSAAPHAFFRIEVLP
jgi:hypothetical protein